jgi:hypothetical protein
MINKKVINYIAKMVGNNMKLLSKAGMALRRVNGKILAWLSEMTLITWGSN